MKKKIITVLGARPQFIKASAMSSLLKHDPDLEEIIVHTGQHFDANMSDVFFQELDIEKPKYALGIGSGSHGAQTGQMLIGIEEILQREKPNVVLVYGDTNSTVAGALAAAKLHIPVAHVEAGLRSFNKKMPEEINRIVTDHVSDYLFTPTSTATQHLLNENIPHHKIYQVGDIMYDVILNNQKKAELTSQIQEKLNLKSKEFVLITLHRAENTDDTLRLKEIIDFLIRISRTCQLVFPIHPRTRKALLKQNLFTILEQHCKLIEPVGYYDMIILQSAANCIITDSGGVQKEAFFVKTPCLTLRNETEWVELLEIGVNRLITPESFLQTTIEEYAEAINFSFVEQVYGQGNTALAIYGYLKDNI